MFIYMSLRDCVWKENIGEKMFDYFLVSVSCGSIGTIDRPVRCTRLDDWCTQSVSEPKEKEILGPRDEKWPR